MKLNITEKQRKYIFILTILLLCLVMIWLLMEMQNIQLAYNLLESTCTKTIITNSWDTSTINLSGII